MIDDDYHEIRLLCYCLRDLDRNFIYGDYSIDAYHGYDRCIVDYDYLCYFKATILNTCAGCFDC